MPEKKEKKTAKPAVKKTAKPASKTTAKAAASGKVITGNTHQKIEAMAFKIYQERLKKGLPGDAMGDWSAAETRVNGKK